MTEPSSEISQAAVPDASIEKVSTIPESVVAPSPTMPRRGFLRRIAATAFGALVSGAALRPDFASAQTQPADAPPAKPEPAPATEPEPRPASVEAEAPRKTRYLNHIAHTDPNLWQNAQEKLSSCKKVYSALQLEGFIDEVRVEPPGVLASHTQTESPHGSAVVESGKNIVNIKANENPQVNANISTLIHEVFHLFDPDVGETTTRFAPLPAEKIAEWAQRREETMHAYDEHYLSKNKNLGHADFDDITGPKDAPYRQLRAEREALAMIGERLILHPKEVPSELDALQKLAREMYETISGQTIEQAQEKIQALGIEIN